METQSKGITKSRGQIIRENGKRLISGYIPANVFLISC